MIFRLSSRSLWVNLRSFDHCMMIQNKDQKDLNNDGIGDACDMFNLELRFLLRLKRGLFFI